MRTKHIIAASAVACVAAASFGVATVVFNDESPAPLYAAGAHSAYASESYDDWVTSADYIADVTVSDEQVGKDGGDFVGRSGLFHVNEVLWSRPGARAFSGDVRVKLTGWAKGSGGEKRPLIIQRGVPRITEGHRYVAALIYLEPRCDGVDEPQPGSWNVIGPFGAVPYDDQILGRGEVEGGESAELSTAPGTVIAASKGKELVALKKDLAMAKAADRPEQRGKRTAC